MKTLKKTICSLATASLILCGCGSNEKKEQLKISYIYSNDDNDYPRIKTISGDITDLSNIYLGINENKEYLLICEAEVNLRSRHQYVYYNMIDGTATEFPDYTVSLERFVSENPDLKKHRYPVKYLYEILEYAKKNRSLDDYIYNFEQESSKEKVKTKTKG